MNKPIKKVRSTHYHQSSLLNKKNQKQILSKEILKNFSTSISRQKVLTIFVDIGLAILKRKWPISEENSLVGRITAITNVVLTFEM